MKAAYTTMVERLSREGRNPDRCEICGVKFRPYPNQKQIAARKGRAWQHPWRIIDHDHKTGFCRGFLCNGCNSFVAWLDADPVAAETFYRKWRRSTERRRAEYFLRRYRAAKRYLRRGCSTVSYEDWLRSKVGRHALTPY